MGRAAKSTASRLVHVSGIGADPKSSSPYIASKGLGEAALRERFRTQCHAPFRGLRAGGRFPQSLRRAGTPLPVLPLFGRRRRDCSRSMSATSDRRPPRRLRLRSRARFTARRSEDDDAARAAELALRAIDRRRPLISVPLGPSRWIAASTELAARATFGFSEIVDDDPRSSRFAGVGKRRLRRGGSRGTRPEGARRGAAARRDDHPILSGAVSPNGTV